MALVLIFLFHVLPNDRTLLETKWRESQFLGLPFGPIHRSDLLASPKPYNFKSTNTWATPKNHDIFSPTSPSFIICTHYLELAETWPTKVKTWAPILAVCTQPSIHPKEEESTYTLNRKSSNFSNSMP